MAAVADPENPPLETFRALVGPEGGRLLATLPAYDEDGALAAAEQARRAGFDAALVAAALTQQRLRQRAHGKLGDAAGRMWFTPVGLEQATRSSVADLRGRRYARLGAGLVADLCCGVGGDLGALAAAASRVVAVDRDPLTAEVARANAHAVGLGDRVEVRCADVLEVDLGGVDAVFIDPARRGARGRTFDPEWYSPPYGVVLGLAAQVAATGAKLAPGIPHAVLPADAEAEWVSDGGDVVECALWRGPLSTGVRRRATLLPSGATVTGDGARRAPVGPVGRYLYEPDGAVIRAGLIAEVADEVAGSLVDPTIAYLTTDRLVRTPFATAYEVREVLPFGLKRLREVLRQRDVGRLTVKKRGSAVEPETLRRQLRLRGDEEATVVLTRVAGRPTVLLVDPVPFPRVDHVR